MRRIAKGSENGNISQHHGDFGRDKRFERIIIIARGGEELVGEEKGRSAGERYETRRSEIVMVQGSIPVHTWITVVSAIRISLSLSVSSLRPFYFFSPRSIGLPVSLTPNTNARLNPAPRFFRERTQSRAMRTCARMKTASNCTDTRERGKDRGGEFLFERCFERARIY